MSGSYLRFVNLLFIMATSCRNGDEPRYPANVNSFKAVVIMVQRAARNFREPGHVFVLRLNNSASGELLAGHTHALRHMANRLQQKQMVI
jgi:hypothetical protein